MSVEMLTGHGRPSKYTKGVKHQRYKDLDTGDIYECELANEYSAIHGAPVGGYLWKLRVDGNGDDHGAGLNADWSVNNPHSGSYIQNRPFHAETYLDVVLPEATIPKKIAYLNDYTSYTRNLERNHEYTVVCDGVEYKCVPAWNDILSSLTIGNPSLASFGDDTGEPFFINSQMNMMMTAIYFATDGPHTISINEGYIETIETLDAKFIPNTVVKSINGITPDENGEVSMMIVKNLLIMDATAMNASILQYYGTETIAEVVWWIRNSIEYYVNFNREVKGTNGKTIETITNTGADIRKVSDGVYNAIVYFGDKYAPIILDSVNNKLTLDPDWVAPSASLTETEVNALIDAKIGVIENGTY